MTFSQWVAPPVERMTTEDLCSALWDSVPVAWAGSSLAAIFFIFSTTGGLMIGDLALSVLGGAAGIGVYVISSRRWRIIHRELVNRKEAT